MFLYLVQHGLADVIDGSGERVLTVEGVAELDKIGAFLDRHRSVTVEAVYHSGKIRALQTAELLAPHLVFSGEITATNGLAPMDDPHIWQERLAEYTHNIMLVGHMPHLKRLAGLLVTGDEKVLPVEIHNGGIVCLDRDPTAGHWFIRWTIVPRLA